VSAVALTNVEIIARCQSGALLDDIERFDVDGPDPASLLNRCVALHNSGQIDLLALTTTERFSSLSGFNFFVRQNFFCDAIPQLQTAAPPLMQAVQAFVAKGGTDLAANHPYEAFRNWCAADLTRAHAIVAASEVGDVQAINFVTFAFTALCDASLARSFVARYSDARRLSALFARGRIEPADAKDAEDSIGVLMPFVDAAYDEAARCNALMPLLDICQRFPALAPAYLPKAIAAAAVTPTPGLLLNLAQARRDRTPKTNGVNWRRSPLAQDGRSSRSIRMLASAAPRAATSALASTRCSRNVRLVPTGDITPCD
jgi:hypothetical protein